MLVSICQAFRSASRWLLCLWGFAAAAALDRVIDLGPLVLPLIAVAAIASVGSVIAWRLEHDSQRPHP